MTEKKKRSPRFKMLDEVDQFVSRLMKETKLSKNEVIESLIYSHVLESSSAPAYSQAYRVQFNNAQIKQKKY